MESAINLSFLNGLQGAALGQDVLKAETTSEEGLPQGFLNLLMNAEGDLQEELQSLGLFVPTEKLADLKLPDVEISGNFLPGLGDDLPLELADLISFVPGSEAIVEVNEAVAQVLTPEVRVQLDAVVEQIRAVVKKMPELKAQINRLVETVAPTNDVVDVVKEAVAKQVTEKSKPVHVAEFVKMIQDAKQVDEAPVRKDVPAAIRTLFKPVEGIGGIASLNADVPEVNPVAETALRDTVKPAAVIASAPILVPMDKNEFKDEVGGRLMFMVKNDVSSARIQINPTNMGPIEINMTVDEDGASITIHAQNQVTKEVLENALPRLREMLQENGLNLADVDVKGGDQRAEKDGDENQQGGHRGEFGEQAEGDEIQLSARVVESDRLVDHFI